MEIRFQPVEREMLADCDDAVPYRFTVLVVEVAVSVLPLFEVIMSTSDLLPDDAGEKRSVMVQVLFTVTVDPLVQVLSVIEKLVPVCRETVPMERASPVPLLVTVIICVLEFWPTVTLPNSMLEALKERLAVDAATPVPLRVTVLLVDVCRSVLPESDGIVRVVESAPVVLGAKRTVMEHVPLAATVCPLHVSAVAVKYVVLTMDAVPMWRAEAPVLVTVTERSFVSPLTVLPKARVLEERLMIGVFFTVKLKV